LGVSIYSDSLTVTVSVVVFVESAGVSTCSVAHLLQHSIVTQFAQSHSGLQLANPKNNENKTTEANTENMFFIKTLFKWLTITNIF
jgi:hypothetical protein